MTESLKLELRHCQECKRSFKVLATSEQTWCSQNCKMMANPLENYKARFLNYPKQNVRTKHDS